VIVDYAHTPDALENLLQAANRIKRNRSICVFGCGGDRDQSKRSMMGEIASKLADYSIITSDNPRTEDPDKILAGITSGITDKTRYHLIPDRRIAIRHAIEIARTGDLVLIAGKGHEDYQIIGKEKLPFDDRQVAREFLRGCLKTLS
jgi:UDP-N-acetylmuramoyl-L-alanyl-D-glutamate--2,6-diaminopimelate ligase